MHAFFLFYLFDNQFAGIFAKTTPDKKYKGVSGVMTVWNPKNVGPNQYSSVAISAEVGEGPDYTRIQFGWTVSSGGARNLC